MLPRLVSLLVKALESFTEPQPVPGQLLRAPPKCLQRRTHQKMRAPHAHPPQHSPAISPSCPTQGLQLRAESQMSSGSCSLIAVFPLNCNIQIFVGMRGFLQSYFILAIQQHRKSNELQDIRGYHTSLCGLLHFDSLPML